MPYCKTNQHFLKMRFNLHTGMKHKISDDFSFLAKWGRCTGFCCRLVNDTRTIALVQAGMQANQFASTIDRTSNKTNFTKNCACKSFFFSQDSKETCSLKLVSAIFYQIFIFHQMIALQKLWKMFLISTKKLFSFLRYSHFCIFIFPCFAPCQPLL